MMMKLLVRIWNDIRRGENVSLYVTVVAAIVVAALSLFGLAPASLVATINLTILALLAAATLTNRDNDKQILEKLAQMPSGSQYGAKIYKHWRVKEIRDLVSRARESVVIVDSWFGSVPDLAGGIRDAEQHANARIKVDVYMLDPDKPFGAQRRAEFDGHPDGTETIWYEKYKSKFEDAVETLRLHLAEAPNAELTIHVYGTMPEIKMYVIDNEEFIFGWFPVFGPSAENVCFHLSASSTMMINLHAIDRLRKQLQSIDQTSRIVE